MDVIHPTHLSCRYRLLQRLLAHGLKPTSMVDAQSIWDTNSFSPLHLAALQGNLEVVDLLLEAGAEVNMTGGSIPTPLGCAAMVSCLFAAATGFSLDPDHNSSSHCSMWREPALLLVPQDWPV